MTTFSIFDNTTRERISDRSYATAEEANHDYHMNAGHTHVGIATDHKRQQFLQVMREQLGSYPWAQADPERLNRTLALAEGTMNGDRKCLIDGPSWLAAWKAIGCKGKPTYKGLHALFANQERATI